MKRYLIFNAFKITALCVFALLFIISGTSKAGAQEKQDFRKFEKILFAPQPSDIPQPELDVREAVRADIKQTQQISGGEETIDNEAIDEKVVEDETADSESEPRGKAALWVNGEKVVLTPAQLAEFNKKLYSCQTKEEYKALVSTIAYYNGGIDLSKFPWYWDDLKEIYTDEQIEMLKNNGNERRKIPSVEGMAAQAAFRKMTDAGFVVRLTYWYSPNSSVAPGYCYKQEFPAGTLWNIDASFFLWIQTDPPAPTFPPPPLPPIMPPPPPPAMPPVLPTPEPVQTTAPSEEPNVQPSTEPSLSPSEQPSEEPSEEPTAEPTTAPPDEQTQN